MNEIEPQYFKNFREHIDKKIESEINGLAVMISNNFATKQDLEKFATKDELQEIRNEMATKDDVKEILSHIGRYEVRAQNTEETLLQDHKPRIAELEKAVFTT